MLSKRLDQNFDRGKRENKKFNNRKLRILLNKVSENPQLLWRKRLGFAHFFIIQPPPLILRILRENITPHLRPAHTHQTTAVGT